MKTVDIASPPPPTPRAAPPRLRGGHRLVTLLAALTALALVMLAPSVASAHGDEDNPDAFTLVRQAIALIVNTPGDEMEITGKLDSALAAEDTDNVDLPLVQQAKAALTGGDLHQARSLLERSIGARVHTSTADPVPIGQPAPVTGEQTGTLAAVDALPGRHGLTTTDWILLAVAVALGALGIVLSARLRPHLPHSHSEGRPS